jgi:sugar phosphate isomerase/epimerase
MKFAICNEMFVDWAIEDVFAHAAAAGYDGVELAPFTLADDAQTISPERRASVRAAAAAQGVQITGLHWLLVKPAGLHLHSRDVAVRERTAAYAEALVDLCADLGGEVLVWGSPQQRWVDSDDTWLAAFERTVAVLQRVGTHAAERGITIAFEPLAPKDNCNFINTVGEGVLLVEAVSSPAVRLHLDTKAMSSEGRPVADTIRLEGGNHLAYFHANDPNLRGPGMGDENFVPILQALNEVGYDGWVSVEVFDFDPPVEETARTSIATLKAAAAAVAG